jgi:hypothetical protein
MEGGGKTLFLCGGTQSSGSTLVSWCFLQRADMNGVLDADNDLLPSIDPRIGTPLAWYKTTISAFRLSELVAHYEDLGWEVRPLLVVRDLRYVWSSLLAKPYAANGITAEDPPLRLRLRRFVEDWEHFLRRGWAILRYESLLAEPEPCLRQACGQLGLDWDDAIIRWPKPPEQIADCQWGNETFWRTRGQTLTDTLASYAKRSKTPALPAADLRWLETEFREFNLGNEYPEQLPCVQTREQPDGPLVPRFEATRRYRWETKRKPLRWLLSCLGVPNRKLTERRSVKRAA